jgi:hypothetical protein
VGDDQLLVCEADEFQSQGKVAGIRAMMMCKGWKLKHYTCCAEGKVFGAVMGYQLPSLMV